MSSKIFGLDERNQWFADRDLINISQRIAVIADFDFLNETVETMHNPYPEYKCTKTFIKQYELVYSSEVYPDGNHYPYCHVKIKCCNSAGQNCNTAAGKTFYNLISFSTNRDITKTNSDCKKYSDRVSLPKS